MSGLRANTKGVLVVGDPLYETLTVETVTNVKPGRLCKKDSGDKAIEVCGAGNDPIGVIGYEKTPNDSKPADIDTAYAADADCAVYIGGAFVFMGILASGESVARGAALIPAANGELAAAAALTIDSGATGVTSSAANGAIISGDIGDDHIVAYAQETVDASGGAERIMALWAR